MFTVTNLNNAGLGSLRDAIIKANDTAGPDTIAFAVAGEIEIVTPSPELNDITGGTLYLGFPRRRELDSSRTNQRLRHTSEHSSHGVHAAVLHQQSD
ncbi:MAG: hypothetical protein FJ403_15770 [Verrucomicrobia bacterium]|nr:hypothetical protein [Verrucomicrobiota bacterium]